MHKLVTAAVIAGALASAGCASRVYVAEPPPPVYVAPAPRAVVVAPAPRAVVVSRACGWRLVRRVRPNGRVVYRRVRVCG
jgi:hypothetical protein